MVNSLPEPVVFLPHLLQGLASPGQSDVRVLLRLQLLVALAQLLRDALERIGGRVDALRNYNWRSLLIRRHLLVKKWAAHVSENVWATAPGTWFEPQY